MGAYESKTWTDICEDCGVKVTQKNICCGTGGSSGMWLWAKCKACCGQPYESVRLDENGDVVERWLIHGSKSQPRKRLPNGSIKVSRALR